MIQVPDECRSNSKIVVLISFAEYRRTFFLGFLMLALMENITLTIFESATIVKQLSVEYNP
ncbi:hypothetical protein AY600_17855 [Phormidium willei BDU 130791]|nr:hypothetical protein AY600_17855 [Phormidium willei BDU 130791]